MPVSYLTSVVKNSTFLTPSAIMKCKMLCYGQNAHTELKLLHKTRITIDLSQPLLQLLILIQLIKHL